jgi:SAM-dependent methyltransferase
MRRPYPAPVAQTSKDSPERARLLDQIREAYADYDRTGRQRLWDAANPGYARLGSDLLSRVLDELRRSLPVGGGRVLDLGCGSGDLYGHAAAAELGTQWTGVDLRPAVIELATSRFEGGDFIVASADAVPRPDSSFDVVVAQVLFSSLPAEALERGVAAEVARLLKPGGWLVWSDLRYANPSNRNVHAVGMNRIQRLFPGWHVDLQPAGLLPPLARRLGLSTPILYPALSAIAPLRSHLVGRLRPPANQ